MIRYNDDRGKGDIMVRKTVQLEHLTLLICMIYVYYISRYSWGLFLALLFVPDISIVFYIFNQEVGKIAYNVVHTYAVPLVILLLDAFLFEHIFVRPVCIIWIIHLSMDRVIGYGLKYDKFKETHIQKL